MLGMALQLRLVGLLSPTDRATAIDSLVFRSAAFSRFSLATAASKLACVANAKDRLAAAIDAAGLCRIFAAIS